MLVQDREETSSCGAADDVPALLRDLFGSTVLLNTFNILNPTINWFMDGPSFFWLGWGGGGGGGGLVNLKKKFDF